GGERRRLQLADAHLLHHIALVADDPARVDAQLDLAARELAPALPHLLEQRVPGGTARRQRPEFDHDLVSAGDRRTQQREQKRKTYSWRLHEAPFRKWFGHGSVGEQLAGA